MMKKTGPYLLFLLLVLTAPGRAQLHPGWGIGVSSPQHELIRGSFADWSGNQVFLFTSGAVDRTGHACALRITPQMTDTVLRRFHVPDTATVLFTGFPTVQRTYLLLGARCRDTFASQSDFASLWMVETDSLLHPLRDWKVDLPQPWVNVAGIKGVLLPDGPFVAAANLLAPANVTVRDDILLLCFDRSGVLVRSRLLGNPLPDAAACLGAGAVPGTTCMYVRGFGYQSDYYRVVVDSELRLQDSRPLLPDYALAAEFSLCRLHDGATLVAATCPVSVTDTDIHLFQVGPGGEEILYRRYGNPGSRDFPGEVQAVARSVAGKAYFAGSLDMNDFQHPNSLFLVRLDENLSPEWERRYSGEANYYVSGIYTRPDGKLLLAASCAWPGAETRRDLFFFVTDTAGNWCGKPGPDATGLTLLYPNPGTGGFFFDSGSTESCTLCVFSPAGTHVATARTGPGEAWLPMDHLQAGLYFVRASMETGKVIVRKWIKNE